MYLFYHPHHKQEVLMYSACSVLSHHGKNRQNWDRSICSYTHIWQLGWTSCITEVVKWRGTVRIYSGEDLARQFIKLKQSSCDNHSQFSAKLRRVVSNLLEKSWKLKLPRETSSLCFFPMGKAEEAVIQSLGSFLFYVLNLFFKILLEVEKVREDWMMTIR